MFGEYFKQPFFANANADGSATPSMSGMTTDGFGSAMGQLAGAIGGAESWQGKIGGIGSNMAKTNIMAKAKKEDTDRMLAMMRLLATGNFKDPEGAIHMALGGPTITAAAGAEGQTPKYLQDDLLKATPSSYNVPIPFKM